MIEFGNITGGCGGCGPRMVHCVTAHVFRYGWTLRDLTASVSQGASEIIGDPVNTDWTYRSGQNFGTLTISGLTVTTSANGAHTCNLTYGQSTIADRFADVQLCYAWLNELVDANWKYAVETYTDTSIAIRLYHFEFVGAPVFANQWVAKHLYTATLSTPQTDEDALDECAAMLDAVDWENLLLFDPAHNLQYTVVKCPAVSAGSSTYDWACNGDTFSGASPGDVLVLGGEPYQSPLLEYRVISKIAVGAGTRGRMSYGIAPTAPWSTYRGRVIVNSPITYSKSDFQIENVEVVQQTVNGPRTLDASQLFGAVESFGMLSDVSTIWGTYIDTAPEFVECSDPVCEDVPVTTSTTPSLTFDAPDPLAVSNTTHPDGHAATVARVLRMGISCASNY